VQSIVKKKTINDNILCKPKSVVLTSALPSDIHPVGIGFISLQIY